MDRVERMGEVIKDIINERSRQEEKWGEQNHDPFAWMTIFGEEFGEACQKALTLRFYKGPAGGGGCGDESEFRQFTHDELRHQLVQCAAVAMAAVECLDRCKWQWGGHALPEPADAKGDGE